MKWNSHVRGAGGWEKKTYKIKPAAHSHTKFKKCIDIKEGGVFVQKKRKKKRKKSYAVYNYC